MLVPIKWLREYTDIKINLSDWLDGMVLSGTNLESVEYPDKNIGGVVAGRIERIEAHPNADRLAVCSVDVGRSEPVAIVTGAANMKTGDCVAVALDGARVPGPLHGKAKNPEGDVIRAGEVRGVRSEGMMCGCQELGFPDKVVPAKDRDGLWILSGEDFVPGTPIVEALGLDEPTADFEITPNRPDCLSMLGIARESAATFGGSVKYPPLDCPGSEDESCEGLIEIEIKKPQLCPRYCCRIIKDIKIAPSPWWLQRALMLAGMRPINNIVDISNYVMLEYGQPLHAFDVSAVRGGKIVVDTASDGDRFTTLDGNERELNSGVLMINDAQGPIAIAGVMGGLSSEIREDTKAVLVESANFNGDCIRKTSGFLRLRTEASGRFEKGIDPNLAGPACDRFCYLVESLGAGVVLGGRVDAYPNPALPVSTDIRASRIRKLIGADISTEQMCAYLNGLEIKTSVNGDIISCTAPTVRQDLFIEEDYVEEVARMFGYDKVPVALPSGIGEAGLTPLQTLRKTVKEVLIGMGVSEIMTYSFVSPKSADKLRLPAESQYRNFVNIINPLGEDTSVMRTTLLPGMMQVLATNSSRRIPAVRFFELGNSFVKAEDGAQLPLEKEKLCIGFYGEGESFFTLKGVAERLLERIGAKGVSFAPESSLTHFHPGRCACVCAGENKLGYMGQLHPDAAENFGLDCEVYAAEFDFETLFALADPSCKYAPLPKFPSMSRDFAMVVKEAVTVGALAAEIKASAGELLEDVKLFDVYRGAPVAPGFKSVAFSLTYRAKDRTLTEAEVNEINSGVLAALRAGHDAVLREM